jgi:hypothetical protein
VVQRFAAPVVAGVTTLDDLADELRRGRVYECSLRDAKWHLDGLRDGENVYIDPRPAILETLLHELLHRRSPRLGERAVTRQARRMVGQMDEATKARWWRQYLRTRKKARPVEVSE